MILFLSFIILKTDLGEKNNVAQENPAIVKELTDLLQKDKRRRKNKILIQLPDFKIHSMGNNILKLYGLSLASLVTVQAAAQKTVAFKQCTPNIVLILMDDMGYGDIGRTGANQYETPNLNRLASQGMQFTWYY